VIGQVGADAGQVRHDGNAEFTKVPGGTMPDRMSKAGLP
jgi:hypothetical protein